MKVNIGPQSDAKVGSFENEALENEDRNQTTKSTCVLFDNPIKHLGINQICSTLSSGESSEGEVVPVPSRFVVTRQIQAPRVRMKEHPPSTPANLSMCLFPRHYIGLTPWKIPTAIATGGAIENPSDLKTALINTLTLMLLTTRKVR